MDFFLFLSNPVFILPGVCLLLVCIQWVMFDLGE